MDMYFRRRSDLPSADWPLCAWPPGIFVAESPRRGGDRLAPWSPSICSTYVICHPPCIKGDGCTPSHSYGAWACRLVGAPVREQPLLQGVLVDTDLTAETYARQAVVAHHPVYPLRLDLKRVSGFLNCEYLHDAFPLAFTYPTIGRRCSAAVHGVFFRCSFTVL